ncbi:sigma-70 family RNA polymerase sigma factor [Clostridium cadaveris]|uniref:sigma-70 family RNA polymerase sigma factor n=1 Tax=Clostridium cadaveris TaxID=1529 RepID=UPI00145943F0|nr:sigma-70 family RNA polymerase sigma factor [Clostridium cadaveris]NME64453.1 sigma-70 family RNA polymerase sigma factor [Clostridium cadaveris]
MNTNDEFRRVEAMLYNYKNTLAEIKILKRDLEILENDYRGTGAISYEEKTGKTNAFSSEVENEVIKRAEKIQRLKNKIRLKEIEIENIDDAIESLLDDEQLLVKERYFNKKSNKHVANLFNVAEQTACDYKSKVINKLMPLLISNSDYIQK